jgi:hypothetical protein
MTGNTATVMIGLGLLTLVLPLGLLVLFLTTRGIDRAHPSTADPPGSEASIPTPRPARADESAAAGARSKPTEGSAAGRR